MATNRIETLDPALIRPGRIDRKIEFPLPDEKTKRRIFQIHTSRMTLSDDVNLDELIMAKDDLSGADIKVGIGGWTVGGPIKWGFFYLFFLFLPFYMCLPVLLLLFFFILFSLLFLLYLLLLHIFNFLQGLLCLVFFHPFTSVLFIVSPFCFFMCVFQ